MTLFGRTVVNNFFWGFENNQEVHKMHGSLIKLVQGANFINFFYQKKMYG